MLTFYPNHDFISNDVREKSEDLPFVYYHGELEHLIGYDLVRVSNDSKDELNDAVNKKTEVEVITDDERAYKANLYMWTFPVDGQYRYKGLIVLAHDEYANNHALDSLNKKSIII